MSTPDSRLTQEISDLEEPSNGSGRLRVAIEITIALLLLVGIYFLFAPEEDMTLPPLPPHEIDPIIRAQVEAADPQNKVPTAGSTDSRSIDDTSPTAVNAPSSTAEILPEGEAARRLISSLRDGDVTLSEREILDQAKAYQENQSTSDAYLLLFYAARRGDGEAAFELASLYDPDHFQAGSSLLRKPNAYQAHKWYSKAAKLDIPQAETRLQALRKKVQIAAEQGDSSARRLLLNWQ